MAFFFVFFALLSVVHLYACYFHLDRLRMATKPLLLLSLAIFYAFAAESFSWLVFLALLCGMAGDIFLLWPRTHRHFVAGACVFSLGHVLYASAICLHFKRVLASFEPWVVVLAALPYAVAVTLACWRIMPKIGRPMLKTGMPFYFGLVALVNVFAWLALVNEAGGGDAFGASLLVAGGILFFISDTILARSIFIEEKERANFRVMLTYITAQLCLCLGFIRLP
jgi:uncharacterized membrane protein YhhN